jgi:hypothetical protein
MALYSGPVGSHFAQEPQLVGEVIANQVVSVTDPYGRILDFLDRSRYFSIK